LIVALQARRTKLLPKTPISTLLSSRRQPCQFGQTVIQGESRTCPTAKCCLNEGIPVLACVLCHEVDKRQVGITVEIGSNTQSVGLNDAEQVSGPQSVGSGSPRKP
jgi:hypothetical protein